MYSIRKYNCFERRLILEKIKKSVWQQIDENEKEKIYAYGEDYKNFLDKAKTEREATSFIIEKAKEKLE